MLGYERLSEFLCGEKHRRVGCGRLPPSLNAIAYLIFEILLPGLRIDMQLRYYVDSLEFKYSRLLLTSAYPVVHLLPCPNPKL